MVISKTKIKLKLTHFACMSANILNVFIIAVSFVVDTITPVIFTICEEGSSNRFHQ